MLKPVRSVGIVLETVEDALKVGAEPDALYHWREPDEIAEIREAIKSYGFDVRLIGTPADFCLAVPELKKQFDFIFNLSVGFLSRFRLSLSPALCETAGIPYSGADPYTKMVSQNKHLMKSFLDALGMPTPEWIYLHSMDAADSLTGRLPEFPLIIKPACEGSSIGIAPDSVAGNREELAAKVRRLMAGTGMPAIVERFVTGREFKVGVIGNRGVEFMGLIEDVDSGGGRLGREFLTFDLKKRGRMGKRPRDIGQPEFALLKKDCAYLTRIFEPLDYCVFDVRVDSEGRHYFLELNADATLHPRRTLAECCALNGISYRDMIGMILRTSFKRWGIPWK